MMNIISFLHNVAELFTDDGHQRMSRVPLAVREQLNESAQARVLAAAAVEFRARVGSEGGQLTVYIHGEVPARIEMFLGDHPLWSFLAGPGEHKIGLPGAITFPWFAGADVREEMSGVGRWRYGIDVMRVCFPYASEVSFTDCRGDLSPVHPSDVPEHSLLTYGSSITQGSHALCAQSSYAPRLAYELQMDHINLGVGGSAQCECAMADYIASRDDWSCCTLEMGINMPGFSVEAFEERVRYMVKTVGGEQQTRPVYCLDMFRHFNDLPDKDASKTEAFRRIVKQAVDDLGGSHTHFISIASVPSWNGLAADILHPNERGMEEMAVFLKEHIK